MPDLRGRGAGPARPTFELGNLWLAQHIELRRVFLVVCFSSKERVAGCGTMFTWSFKIPKELLAAAAIVLSISPASAADWSNYSPYIWSGLYLGAHGGGGSFDAHNSLGSLNPNPLATGDDYNGDGGLFGLLAGYNFQNGRFVYGVEGDVSFGSVSGSPRN